MENNILRKITLYTDGACRPNPGFGGWGAVMILGEHEKELGGFSPVSTNNIMELTSVIEPLSRLKEPCEVIIFSDSKYVCDGATSWMFNWQKKGWDGIKNPELWKKLFELNSFHKLKFNWVKGHANNKYNNLCDELAVRYIMENKTK